MNEPTCDCCKIPATWEVVSGGLGECTAPPEALEVSVDGLILDLKTIHKERILNHMKRGGKLSSLPPDLLAVLRRATETAKDAAMRARGQARTASNNPHVAPGAGG
jgi:hypothetical protein